MTRPIRTISLILFIVCGLDVQAQELELKARSLGKRDLPIGFPIQTLDSGFAVIEITVTNTGDTPLNLDPASIQLAAPKKKKLTRVLPTKIVPKLLKFYRPGRGGVSGEATFGNPYPGSPNQLPTPQPLPPAPRDTSYSVDTARTLRTLLEGYELKGGTLESGVSNQGYLYVKSKRWGPRLKGGTVTLGQNVAVIESPSQ